MKITITGAHGAGKTTICEQLTKIYPDLYYIKETAREQIAKFGKLPQNMSIEERCKFQEAVLDSQIEQELLHPSFIADRSVFDVLAYSLDLPVTFFQKLWNKAINHYDNHGYDFIFYVPIEFIMENDGIRPPNVKYQELIGMRIKTLLATYNLDYNLFKLSGSLDQRVKTVQLMINNY